MNDLKEGKLEEKKRRKSEEYEENETGKKISKSEGNKKQPPNTVRCCQMHIGSFISLITHLINRPFFLFFFLFAVSHTH